MTGHGLAGGSGVTLVVDLPRLPLLPGADRLARSRAFLTRASTTNRAYVAADLRTEGKHDPLREEFFYDAQTSGGLLISVAGDRAEGLVAAARAGGATAACVIGEVTERGDVALVLRG